MSNPWYPNKDEVGPRPRTDFRDEPSYPAARDLADRMWESTQCPIPGCQRWGGDDMGLLCDDDNCRELR